MSALLEIRDLHTAFRSEKKLISILDGVSITLNKGEIIGIVGESGSGKSVTMMSTIQLLSGSGQITGGEVTMDGNPDNILSYKPKSRDMQKIRGGKIAMIFQEPMTSLNPVLTVGEQIQEAVMLHLGLGKEEAKKKAVDMMKLVNIPDAEERYSNYPQQFSGGMRQRIMIAMALASEPEVLIADEATTALDVTTQAQLLDIVKHLVSSTGISAIIVTHNLGIVARYADRIYVMYSGNVVETADCRSLFRDPRHPYTRGLLKAIPRLDDPKDRVLIPIDGLPPLPQDRPPYCPFYARCPYACDRCKESGRPPLAEVAPGHFAACLLTKEELDAMGDRTSAQALKERPKKQILDEACLTVSHLGKRFDITKGMLKRKVGEFNALEDLSFQINKGETLGIVGESGCGKTTMARCLMRMYEPEEGSIVFDGTDVTHARGSKLKEYRKNISMVFQDPFSSLDPRMSAGDIAGEPLKVQHLVSSSQEYDDRVNELFTLVGLDPALRDRYPHEFSGGQRQRLSIARALASKPRLLVLDEPISALDVSIQAQIINLLEDLQARFGFSYLFIAHDIAVVKHISDRILVMYLGRIMEIADSEELCDHPLHPYTRALLSSVPIADPDAEENRLVARVKGEIPSVLNRPKGCPFSDRCPFATIQCMSDMPPLEDHGHGHLVACFQAKEIK